RKPALSFMRPFGCPVTILNTIDHLGKFDGKVDEGFFVGHSTNSKAFRVFNSRTRIVEENLHVKFDENIPNIAGSGPNWLFDIDALTKSMNYKPVVAGNQSNGSVGTKACDNVGKARVKTVPGKDYILLPLWTQDLPFYSKDSPDAGFKPSGEEEKKDVEDPRNEDSEAPSTEESRVNQEKDANVNITNNINTVSLTDNADGIEDNVVDENIVYSYADDPNMPELEYIVYSNDDEDGKRAIEQNGSYRNNESDVKRIFRYLKVKDAEAEDVDVPMIGSLMYLTASRPDIMFVVCACERFQVTPKVSHLHAVKRIFRYLNGNPKMDLWYPKQLLKQTNDEIQRSAVELTYYWLLLELQLLRVFLEYKMKTSLIALKFVDSHNMVAYLEKSTENNDFDEIVDFLNASSIRYALTETKRPTEISQSSRPTTLIADETIHEERGDNVERAATTAASLDAEQDNGSGPRRQDTILGDKPAQTRVLDLESVKVAQALEIKKLKKRVKKLESRKKSRTLQLKRRLFKERNEIDQDEGTLWFQEDAETQGRYNHDAEVITASAPITTADVSVSTVEPSTPPTTTTLIEDEDFTIAQTLMKIRISETASRPIVPSQQQLDPKDKGKGIMQEPKKQVKVKGKDQIVFDEEIARRLEAEMQVEVWTLVDLPYGKRAIGTKWVYMNKKDERGIVIRNKARLVAQGYTQEEGIDYDEVFAPIARIEAIRLFLAYSLFKEFVVYLMDVKIAFLYGKIEKEVYVCQPPVFEDPEFPDRVYKVEKALYGLHQAPRAWYETLSTYLLDNGFHRGQIDKTLFIKRVKGDILLV
ncbi:retrovirus-related pol polyprotein from transposon TNT 1-94, partial [Tanacetum coccineum]